MDNKTEQPIPKMDFKLSAFSDVAAIEYSRKNSGGELDGRDLTNAFEAGISWLWRHLHSLPPSPVREAGSRWVKCIKRMPTKVGEYPIRFIATGEKKIGHFGRNSIIFTDDNLSINKEHWEWLDESPNPSRAGEAGEDMTEQWKIKAQKWDTLSAQIGKFYTNSEGEFDEESPENGGDLTDIGEVAARAFGWL